MVFILNKEINSNKNKAYKDKVVGKINSSKDNV